MARLFKIVCGLIRDLTGLYRPERHYMRGPGPAWRAKHLKPETLTGSKEQRGASHRRRLLHDDPQNERDGRCQAH